MKVSMFRLFSITIITVLLLAAFVPQAVVVAADEPATKGTAVPVPKSPHGTILDTTPTYKWTKITGATVYRYQVWKGTTLVLDKSPVSDICGATLCEKSPAVTLGYNSYKWRVKAYKSGGWSAWSAYKNFTVSPPAFDSQFNGDMTGWARKAGGIWWVNGSKYLNTNGLGDKWTSAYRTTGQYTDFDYSAKMLREGPDANYIVARMGTSVNPTDSHWYPGYYFGYTNDGNYSIYYVDDSDSWQTIQDWTPSSAIDKNNMTTLRVVAEGNQFWFYINGILMKYFTDNSRSRGYVGVATYRNSASTTSSYYVDWATLTVKETVQ